VAREVNHLKLVGANEGKAIPIPDRRHRRWIAEQAADKAPSLICAGELFREGTVSLTHMQVWIARPTQIVVMGINGATRCPAQQLGVATKVIGVRMAHDGALNRKAGREPREQRQHRRLDASHAGGIDQHPSTFTSKGVEGQRHCCPRNKPLKADEVGGDLEQFPPD
jgi:hypothetical protein